MQLLPTALPRCGRMKNDAGGSMLFTFIRSRKVDIEPGGKFFWRPRALTTLFCKCPGYVDFWLSFLFFFSSSGVKDTLIYIGPRVMD